MFRKLADDKDFFKFMFEHYRNIGICAALFGAAFLTIKHSSAGWWLYAACVSAATMTLIGIFLFWANERNGYRRLRDALSDSGWALVVQFFHAVCVFQLLLALSRIVS